MTSSAVPKAVRTKEEQKVIHESSRLTVLAEVKDKDPYRKEFDESLDRLAESMRKLRP